MLMSHDAATGYLVSEDNPIYAWTRTQSASAKSFTQQLECGVRAFDFRGHVDEANNLIFHHGGVAVERHAADAVAEIVAWANGHPAVEDLVLIYSWDCSGSGCAERMEGVFSQAGILVATDCVKIAGSALGDVASMARLADGGHVLVMTGCVDQNFNQSLTCSGFDKPSGAAQDGRSLQLASSRAICGPRSANSTFEESRACGEALRPYVQHARVAGAPLAGYYTCWRGGHASDFPLGRLLDALQRVAARPPAAGQLAELQALWQETPSSVEIGIAHLSSLLKDEEQSGLNALLVQQISSGAFQHIGLFEVNNACDHGPDLLAALRAHHARRARARRPPASPLLV